VTYEDDIYLFNRSVDYDYDVEHFQREISLAQSAGEIEMPDQTLQSCVEYVSGTISGKD